jgi:queuine/archaeosine tRNA-ribosyltransferase
MNRIHGPLITDSGGFQVFSLAYGSVHESLENQGELKRVSIHARNRDPNANGTPPVKVTEVSTNDSFVSWVIYWYLTFMVHTY